MPKWILVDDQFDPRQTALLPDRLQEFDGPYFKEFAESTDEPVAAYFTHDVEQAMTWPTKGDALLAEEHFWGASLAGEPPFLTPVRKDRVK